MEFKCIVSVEFALNARRALPSSFIPAEVTSSLIFGLIFQALMLQHAWVHYKITLHEKATRVSVLTQPDNSQIMLQWKHWFFMGPWSRIHCNISIVHRSAFTRQRWALKDCMVVRTYGPLGLKCQPCGYCFSPDVFPFCWVSTTSWFFLVDVPELP